MGEPALIGSRAIADKKNEARGLKDRELHNPTTGDDVTRQFLLQIGLHPAAGKRGTGLTGVPLSIADWAKQKEEQERSTGTLKERIHADFIYLIKDLKRRSVSDVRTRTSPDFANAVDLVLGAVATSVFVIFGMASGGVEILLNIIPSLVQLMVGVAKFLGSAVGGLAYAGTKRGDRANVHVNETIANLVRLPTVLEFHVAEFGLKFAEAPTEKQSIMIGELCSEIIALLAPATEGIRLASGAAKITQFSIPKYRLTPTRGGALALEQVGEAVIAVAPRALQHAATTAVAGSTAMMAAGKPGGGAPAKSQQTRRGPGTALRKEPTLKNAGWGPRPPGAYNNAPAEAFATKACGSKESIYVGSRWTEFDGLRSAEELGLKAFPGYRPSERFLLDAKYASQGGRYDIYWKGGKRNLSSSPNHYLANEIVKEAFRQGNAWANSGASGIVWIISDQGIATGLRKLFKERQIGIKVISLAP